MNVIITGAARGLGLELTRIHAEHGDRVYAFAQSLTDDLNALAEKYPGVLPAELELTDEDAVRTALGSIGEKSVDTLYNVAGIWYLDQRVGIEDTDLDKVKEVLLVNAVAPVCVLKDGKKLLKDGGIVLNVSSEAGSIARCYRDMEYGYAMSKAALNMASVTFRNETREQGIRVYCFHPGWMRTRMGGERAAASPESIAPEEAAEALYDCLYNKNDLIPGMFFDYLNHPWPW